MPVPDFQTWLASIPRDGNRRINPDVMPQLEAAYQQLLLTDSSGRNPYGTNILGGSPLAHGVLGNSPADYGMLGFGSQADTFTRDGQTFQRTGGSYQDLVQRNNDPWYTPFYSQIGQGDIQYDPEQGYYMDANKWNQTVGEGIRTHPVENTWGEVLGGLAMTMGPAALSISGLGGALGNFTSGFGDVVRNLGNIGSTVSEAGGSVGGGNMAGLFDFLDVGGSGTIWNDLLNYYNPADAIASMSATENIFGPFANGTQAATAMTNAINGAGLGSTLSSGGLSALNEGGSTLNEIARGVRNLFSGNGGGLDLGGMLGGGADLAARIAPGLAALQFARNQNDVNVSPDYSQLGDIYNRYQSGGFDAPIDTSRFGDVYSNAANLGRSFDTSQFNQVYNKATDLGRGFDVSGLSNVMQDAGGLKREFDTSNFSNLSNQVGDLTDQYRSSVLKDYDLRSGQARGQLQNSLTSRGVMGSSFGNMDLANFDTTREAQRGKLAGEIGLQGIQAQRGLSQDILGAQQAQRGFEQAGLGLQGNLAQALVQAQQAQRGFEQAGLGTQLQAAGGIQGANQAARGFEAQGLQTQLQAAQQMMQAEALRRQFGLQSLQGQGGLANTYINSQNQGVNAQLQNNAIRSALYGRAFDVLGRAVSPSVYGR